MKTIFHFSHKNSKILLPNSMEKLVKYENITIIANKIKKENKSKIPIFVIIFE